MKKRSSGTSLRTRLFHLFFLFRRPMTLGVRVIVPDGEGAVLLVRHTYVAGWHLPGGGVEKGETAGQAAQKELLEETGIRSTGTMETLAVLANRRASRRDHVVLYLCREWERERSFLPNREIAEADFFPLDNLPEETSDATRNRLMEAFGDRIFPEYW